MTAVLKVKEAAGILGVSSDTLYAQIKQNQFPPARKIGGRIVIGAAAFAEWLGIPRHEVDAALADAALAGGQGGSLESKAQPGP